MKRRLFTLMVLLAAGAFINITVAWICSAVGTDMATLYVAPGNRVALLPNRTQADGPRLLGIAVIHERDDEIAIGFPWKSMRYDPWLARFDLVNGAPTPWAGGLFINTPQWLIASGLVHVPLLPRWPGFALNTVFFAGLCWLVFIAPFARQRYQRWQRLRHGLCPACGYPAGSSPVCTECGTALDQTGARR